MMQKIIDNLALYPRVFIFLRRVIENNFKEQKKVIREKFKLDLDEKILDIGCGTGEFSVFFNPESYIGIDIEDKYIKFAKKNYNGRFILGDAKKLPFLDNSFEKVVIIGVLHHLNDKDSKEILKEADRVLKRGCKLLVMEDVDSKEISIFSKLIHYLDKGKYIRTKHAYGELLISQFKIIKSFIIKSGLCPYQVYLLKCKDGKF